MTADQMRDWLVAISASASMITVASGLWHSLREYRLKLQGERRLEKAAEIEAHIRLMTLFSDLMRIANGRSGYSVSEKAIEWYLSKQTNTNVNTAKLNDDLEDLAIMRHPVGSAAQDSAIAAIAVLAEKHDILRTAAAQALQSLREPHTSPVVETYLGKIAKLEGVKIEPRAHTPSRTTLARLAVYLADRFQRDPTLRERLRLGEPLSIPVELTSGITESDIQVMASEVMRLQDSASQVE